jgi:Ser/Thr protein kinase RdoA (MazF antagonist)
MSALARVPRQVCHGDAQCANLFPQSPKVTIAIDWANLATGPVGIDAATLLHYALAYFHQEMGQADDLDRHIFDGYARGAALCEETTLRQARLAYVAQLALGIGLLEIAPVLRLVSDPDRRRPAEEFYRRSLHDILDRRSQLAEFLLDLGQEARALATQLP